MPEIATDGVAPAIVTVEAGGLVGNGDDAE
jgi:hypothetical protein